MSFRYELNRLLQPDAMVVEAQPAAMPYSRIVGGLKATFPNAVLDRIYFPKTATDVYLARLTSHDRDTLFVTVDPYSGHVLHLGSVFAFPIEAAFYLHNDLLAGTAGHYIIGIAGIGLLALCVLGLVLWWPGRRHLRNGFRVQLQGPRRRQLFDMHRVPGAALSAVFIVGAMTGSAIALDSFVRPALAAVAPFSEPPRLPPPIQVTNPASVDQVLARAAEEIGSTRIRDWQFGAAHRVRFYDTNNFRPDALDTLWLDVQSGRVLAVIRAGDAQIGNKILDWMFPIHTGRVLGLPGRILVCASGLALLLVSACGLWMWLERRRIMRRTRSAIPA